MATIIDASAECPFSDRKIVFDTNVWIYIDGADPRPEKRVYSNFYDSALKKNNVIVTNDYIIGEFFNRSCKLQYDLLYADDPSKRKFKERRKSDEFKEFMETIRDTCLNMKDDCHYHPALTDDCKIEKLIEEVATGTLDFSDVVLKEFCIKNGYPLVSHDADFAGCGFDLITANSRVLRARGR